MKPKNKNIKEGAEFVRLADTNYSNLKFDSDDTKNDEISKELLDDIQIAASNADLTATITTGVSGHQKHVKGSKNISRHTSGAAVDISILNGKGSGSATNSSNGNSEFRRLGNKLKDELVSMGYSWNTESGNDKAVLWQTNTGGNHYNHLHISNKTGLSSSGSNNKTKKSDTSDEGLASTLLGIANNYIVKPTFANIGNVLDKSEFLKALKKIGSDVEAKYDKLTPKQQEMWEQNEKLKKLVKKIL